jgi:LysM repeat protein
MAARGSGRAVWVIVLALVLAACSGGDGGEDGGQVSATPTAVSSTGADVPSEAATDGTGGPGGAQTYVVESGDTLAAIADRFDTTVRAIVRANDLADPDVIDVGQELTIP